MSEWKKMEVWADSPRLWDLLVAGWEIVEKTVGLELLTLRREIWQEEPDAGVLALARVLKEREIQVTFEAEYEKAFLMGVADMTPGNFVDGEAAFLAVTRKALRQIGVSEGGSIDFHRWWIERKIKAAPTGGTIV